MVAAIGYLVAAGRLPESASTADQAEGPGRMLCIAAERFLGQLAVAAISG